MVCSSFSSTSMGPSGELQSFKNRLLQHGSPTNPSSKNCSSLGFSPQTTACARILFLHGLSMGCRSYLLHPGPLMGSREIHALCLEHLLPSFCTNLGGYRVVSPPFSHPSLSQLSYSFLTMLSQRCHQVCWWVQFWPIVGPFWNSLQLAGNWGSSWFLLTMDIPDTSHMT